MEYNAQDCIVLALSKTIGDSLFFFCAQKKPEEPILSKLYIPNEEAPIIKYGPLFTNEVSGNKHKLVDFELDGTRNDSNDYQICIHNTGLWSDHCNIATLEEKYLNDNKEDKTLISCLLIEGISNASECFINPEHKSVKKIWGVHYLRTSDKISSVISSLESNYQNENWLETLNSDTNLKKDAPQFLKALNTYHRMIDDDELPVLPMIGMYYPDIQEDASDVNTNQTIDSNSEEPAKERSDILAGIDSAGEQAANPNESFFYPASDNSSQENSKYNTQEL